MATTRPRRSLLELFDPLEAETERDTSSPDSDKENAFDTTSLFGQPKTIEHPSPVKLRRRLVDVGDVTTDEPSLLCMLTDEEELEEVGDDDERDPTINLQNLTPVRDNVKNPQSLSSFSIIRTPLRELQLDQDSAPAAAKTFKRAVQATSPLALSASSNASALPRRPEASGISSIIDSVNTSGICFASPSRTKELVPVHEEEEPSTESEDCDTTPEAVVAREYTSPHEVILDGVLELSLGDASHFESTPAVDARLPASTLGKAKLDVDPQASFQLNLQSEEASFDLLKDRISFFASPGNDDNDTFDMTTEMEKMQQIIVEAGLAGPSQIPQGQKVLLEETAQEPSPKTPLNASRPTRVERRVEGVSQNAPAKPTSHIATAKAPVFIRPPALEESSAKKPNKPSIPAPSRRSSLAVRGSAVPALRIVKRGTFQDHEPLGSSRNVDPVVSSTPSVTPVASEQAPVTGSCIQKPVQNRLQRRVSVGLITNTKPGTATSTTGAKRLTVADRGRLSANPPAVIRELSKSTTAGPRRAPITQGASAVTHDRGSLSKSTTTAGSRRMSIAAPIANPTIEKLAPTTARKPADALGGLKAPIRQPRPSVNGTSTLPRPSLSRMPAPSVSGIARPTLGSVGRTSGNAMSGRNPVARKTHQ